MRQNKYAFHRFSLRFQDPAIEEAYRTDILTRTLLYFRITWGSVLVFGGYFALLDRSYFHENASTIIAARAVVLAIGAVVFAWSLWKPARTLALWHAVIFIPMLGTFCALQTALSPTADYSPYVMGIFWIFAGGIFGTPGLGFTRSVACMVLIVALFELFLGVLWPTDSFVLIVYNAFIVSITGVFVLVAHLVERIYRQSYVVSARLRDSLDEVKTLSGLLPICAACKKVRDDRGYWNRIENYLSSYTDIRLSHGICPDCVAELYPDFSQQTSGTEKED